MYVEDEVRLYEGEWFSRGLITLVDGETVTVDFSDWIQQYRRDDLRLIHDQFQRQFWLPTTKGVTIQKFS